MVTSEHTKRKALIELAREIDANPNWWRFPEEPPIKGFLGASSIVLVGDQPSTSPWLKSHPSRRTFYDTLNRIEASDAHLTDLYKKRGRSSALRNAPLPNDFNDHLLFFQREIEILQPTHVVGVGKLAYDLMFRHLEKLRPVLVGWMWHFSYVVQADLQHKYEANMRKSIWRTQV